MTTPTSPSEDQDLIKRLVVLLERLEAAEATRAARQPDPMGEVIVKGDRLYLPGTGWIERCA